MWFPRFGHLGTIQNTAGEEEPIGEKVPHLGLKQKFAPKLFLLQIFFQIILEADNFELKRYLKPTSRDIFEPRRTLHCSTNSHTGADDVTCSCLEGNKLG